MLYVYSNRNYVDNSKVGEALQAVPPYRPPRGARKLPLMGATRISDDVEVC